MKGAARGASRRLVLKSVAVCWPCREVGRVAGAKRKARSGKPLLVSTALGGRPKGSIRRRTRAVRLKCARELQGARSGTRAYASDQEASVGSAGCCLQLLLGTQQHFKASKKNLFVSRAHVTGPTSAEQGGAQARPGSKAAQILIADQSVESVKY